MCNALSQIGQKQIYQEVKGAEGDIKQQAISQAEEEHL